jgi:hypothetical protein
MTAEVIPARTSPPSAPARAGCDERCAAYEAALGTPARRRSRGRPPRCARAALLPGGRTAPGRAALADDRGQSAVEVVALLPLLFAVAVGLFTLLAAAKAREDAAQAAEAGAVALLHDGDARAAACAALGRPEHCGAGVRIHGRRVTVTLPPRGPIHRLNRELQASKTADAGPGPAP